MDTNSAFNLKPRFSRARTQVTIVSYPLLNNPSIIAQIEERAFKVVIADESHYVKDAKAKRTKALLPVLKRAKRCVLLSGTPALNRPRDLYTQVDALRPGSFGTFMDFAKRYCGGAVQARPRLESHLVSNFVCEKD